MTTATTTLRKRGPLRGALIWAPLVLVLACGDSNEAETPGVRTSGTSSDAGGREGPQARSLLLLTLDTTNPGALDVYGKDRGVTPHLAELARSAQIFDAARTVAPLTLPSHASMLTGLVPPRHGVRDNGLGALPDAAETLAESAASSGRRTGAFVSAAVIDAAYGTAQGFQDFSGPSGRSSRAGSYMVERSASETVAGALEWLDASDEPFFLWVHLFDPHVPYEAAPEFVSAAGGNLYLAEVASMDSAIGMLLEALPPANDCAVIAVADHGESLGRHGEPTHSLLVHDATMHVPFVVRWPDGRAAGTRSMAPVSVCDVYPTALGLLGLPDHGDHEGVDLVQPPPPSRLVYFESYAGYIGFGLAPLAGVADARGKWIGGPDARWYPGEAVPVDGQRTQPESGAVEAASRYRRGLEILVGKSTLAAASTAEDMGDAMRSLGYAGTGTLEQELPSVLVDTGRPAVAEGLADALLTLETMTVAGAGLKRDARRRFEEIVGRNPRNVMATFMLGSLLMEDGRHEDAQRLLTPLAESLTAGPDLLVMLSDALIKLDRRSEAIPYLEKARRARPRDPNIQARLKEAQQ